MSPKVTLTENSINQTYKFGENATLVCNSTGGPGNAYLWQKDGRYISGQNSSVLELPDVTVATGGNYTCVVSNAAGNHSANTYVFVFPYFLKQPQEVVLTSAESEFNVSCVAVAFPDPEYQWGREDSQIRMGILANQSVFTISSVQFGDDGNYYCNATSNGFVNTSKSTRVTGKLINLGPACHLCNLRNYLWRMELKLIILQGPLLQAGIV